MRRPEISAAVNAELDRRGEMREHPDLPTLAPDIHVDADIYAAVLLVPTVEAAEAACDAHADRGDQNWGAIAALELAEVVEAAANKDNESLRRELIQLAAVAVAWLESL